MPGGIKRAESKRAERYLWPRALASLGLFLVALELCFRSVSPSPRFQIVRADRGLQVRQGIPIWRDGGSLERQNAGCVARHPGALHIAFFGSSIFFGTGVDLKQTFAFLLQRDLDARFGVGKVCVLNYAQPGYGATSKLAEARELLPKLKGDIIVWEVWNNDPWSYAMLGSGAYALRDARVDAAGYPDAFSLPAAVNHFLFQHSRAYEFASLSQVPLMPPLEWSMLIRSRVVPVMDEVLARARAHGNELWLVPAAQLDRPFSEQLHDPNNSVLRDWADEKRVPYRELAELLGDQDMARIRLDPCCHYNVQGHAVLAQRMLELLSPQITGRVGR